MKVMNEMKKFKKMNLEIIFLIIILGFAFFLRVYALGNPVFWIDEAISANVGKAILEKGVPVLDSGWNYSNAYFLHYTQAFFMLFGQNEFFARFPSVIFGLLTIVLVYFIGKEYSKTGGIISALFMSVFYLEVFFSRQARYYQLFQLAFFACLYLLYKSKGNQKYLYLSLICFFIAWDTHVEALVLAPFLILHILIYNKQKWLAVLPAIPLVQKFIPVLGLSAGSTEQAANYMRDYFAFAYKMRYLLGFFIPGVIWGFVKNKRLTLLMILPSIVTLIGVFSLKVFGLRYSYFFVFPLVLYSSLLLSFLYEKYGKILLIAIVAVLIFPSNLFFPYSYVNVIKPVDNNLGDYSAPFTDYKAVPENLVLEMRNSTLISLYSADVEFYIKKPNFVIPFTMTGQGDDQISMNKSLGKVSKIEPLGKVPKIGIGMSEGEMVDRYSGALILKEKPQEFYLTADLFSVSKLKPYQKEAFNKLTENCSVKHNSRDLKIYYCGEEGESVYRIIDGDTFELGSGERVRLICIDTPEIGQKEYAEAKEFLSGLILGKRVRLEKDVSEKDAYGRLLRYVYVGDLFVNKELVEKGYASVFRYGNDTARCDEIKG